ncbi:MAG: sugar phosphate isomerase/epimerase [Anaerolineae bacterium]|nr:sugar phosphate isomerase/epimerase [Anaerolineae bacterium]
MNTRTGNFPIGWRRRNFDWEKNMDPMIAWAKANDLGLIDVGRDGETSAKAVIDAGLKVGSADLAVWEAMISADKGKRKEAVAQNAEYIKNVAALGVSNFFMCMLPENRDGGRAENFGYMVESYGELAPAFEAAGAHLVIEGWPGPASLVCTPETYGAFFEQVPSMAMGVNYDPSHLLRMGIDPLRFLREFKDRVYHVHGKDCMIIQENQYRYGNLQEPTFGQKFGYGAMHWRYTIPGHGLTDWIEVFTILKNNGYRGAVCIELEDHYFDKTDEATQLGVLQGARFLTGC